MFKKAAFQPLDTLTPIDHIFGGNIEVVRHSFKDPIIKNEFDNRVDSLFGETLIVFYGSPAAAFRAAPRNVFNTEGKRMIFLSLTDRSYIPMARRN